MWIHSLPAPYGGQFFVLAPATQTNRPKVLVVVLCSLERANWWNPSLSLAMAALTHDPRFSVTLAAAVDCRPVACARNHVMKMARDEFRPEWLLMVDADSGFFGNPLDLIAHSAAAGKHVIGMPAFQFATAEAQKRGQRFEQNVRGAVRRIDGPFAEVERVGAGALFVNRVVWETVIPTGPWFKFLVDDTDEILPLKIPEDFVFCDALRAKGCSVWVARAGVMHFHTCEMSSLALQTRGA